MNTYKYQAISKSGEKVNGIIEGFNQVDAVNRIKQSCDIVVKINEVGGENSSILAMEIGRSHFNSKAFTVICSQFATILKSGIPIARAVRLIANQTTDKVLKKLLQEVAEDVESGRSLATSFEDKGGDFLPTTFIETIRAGESSGSLDKAFATMYQHYDKQTKMAGKVRQAMAYPLFVLFIAVIVVIVLMVKVVPTFTDIFESYGAELPAITRALIAISNFFKNYWVVFLSIIVIFFASLKIAERTEKGKIAIAKAKLKLPLLGKIELMSAASQFSNNMATLIGAGLPLNNTVKITARVIENYYISHEISKINSRIEEGFTLGDSIKEVNVLPDILNDMVAVGEETGELESTMVTVADYYDNELEMAIKSALDKLEPALLVTIAVIAGFIVLAVYIAMFEMYGVM